MRRRALPTVLLIIAIVSNASHCTRRPDIEWVTDHEASASDERRATSYEKAVTPESLRRGEDQTFLTIPEWYLVFSSAEYADVLAESRPSSFPYMAHVGQFWSSYNGAWKQTRSRYPFNPGYHVMVVVIGVSTTAEYGAKSAYESTIGQITELGNNAKSNVDQIAQQTAESYQDFIRKDPWYLYDFWTPLGAVLSSPITGLRSIERKYFLSTEYAVKGLYGALLTWATGSIYGSAGNTTACVLASDTSVTMLPRYEAFMYAADSLSKVGRTFSEIAGVRGEIVVSAIAPRPFSRTPSGSRVLFEQPILTKIPNVRIVFAVGVPELTTALQTLSENGWKVEHIYDY